MRISCCGNSQVTCSRLPVLPQDEQVWAREHDMKNGQTRSLASFKKFDGRPALQKGKVFYSSICVEYLCRHLWQDWMDGTCLFQPRYLGIHSLHFLVRFPLTLSFSHLRHFASNVPHQKPAYPFHISFCLVSQVCPNNSAWLQVRLQRDQHRLQAVQRASHPARRGLKQASGFSTVTHWTLG